MAASRRDMLAVVLVDADADASNGPDGEPPDATSPAGGPARGSWLRRSRRWLPVVAGVTLVLVTVAVVTDRRENLRMAALADVPGVLAPLDGPVDELWHNDGAQYSGLAVFAGRLLAAEDHPDGSADVVALDPRTGEAAWRTEARPAGAPMRGWTGCAFPDSTHPAAGDTPIAAVVACVVVDETISVVDGEFGESSYPSKARLLVVDAASGAVLSDRSTAPSTTVSLLGRDLVLSQVDADGRVRVTRTDELGAGGRWTFLSPEPVGLDPFGQRSAWARVAAGDAIVVTASGDTEFGAGGSTWVLSADGDVTRSLTSTSSLGFRGGIDVLRGGKLFAEPATNDDGTEATTITDVTTGRSFTADAYPSGANPDDGSLADLLLMHSSTTGQLIAYDLASGQPAWEVRATDGGSPPVLIDGRVVRAGTDGLTCIDGRTGANVWTTPIEQGDQSSLVTDGRLVLLTQRSGEGGAVISAYGLDDGRLRWESDIADDLWLIDVGGGLYGWSERGLVALG